MTPREIVVGATYRHSDYPGFVYLGCGDYFDNLPARRKFLIILKEPAAPTKFCAARVKFSRDEVSRKWWQKLDKI